MDRLPKRGDRKPALLERLRATIEASRDHDVQLVIARFILPAGRRESGHKHRRRAASQLRRALLQRAADTEEDRLVGLEQPDLAPVIGRSPLAGTACDVLISLIVHVMDQREPTTLASVAFRAVR